jgi:hypothetical protein
MEQQFTSTKDFSVGDLFLNADGQLLCFIVKITQHKKDAECEYQLEYFRERPVHHSTDMYTLEIKDRVNYWGWKHIPVVK